MASKMQNDEVLVVGIQRGISKKNNKPYVMVHYISDNVPAGFVGQTAAQQYFAEVPSEIVPGMICRFLFGMNAYGQAGVVGIVPSTK